MGLAQLLMLLAFPDHERTHHTMSLSALSLLVHRSYEVCPRGGEGLDRGAGRDVLRGQRAGVFCQTNIEMMDPSVSCLVPDDQQ